MISRHLCPVCSKPLTDAPIDTAPCFPFCSSRCRQIDLYRWSKGSYAIVENIAPDLARLLDAEARETGADPEDESAF